MAARLCALVLLIGAAPVEAQQAVEAASTQLRWLTDWETACGESRLEGRPLLAVTSLPQCPWCRAFDETLATERVRSELRGLVLVRLDLSANASVADQLGLTGAPISVLIAATGVAVDRREGYAPPDEFLLWLRDARAEAEKLSPQALAAGPVERLVSLLGHRDPVVRQIAIDVLAKRGERQAVVEAFSAGGLAVKLSALEAFAAWDAPLGDADPWKPDTISPALERLREWAQASEGSKSQAPPSREEIEHDLHSWMTAEDGPQTQAVYERLARAGLDLLPLIEERMPTTWNRPRQRLLALKYRLLLTEDHARRLPDVPFKMASANPQTRLQALNTLSEQAHAGLKDFFVEASHDPDGKVREAAVRGLLRADVEIAREGLAGMLSDPSAEVRATVLKELAKSPSAKLATALTAYVAQETEVDLIVQAAGVLGDLRAADEAFDALLHLTGHDSWRVRAAAVQALGNVGTSSSTARSRLSADKHPRLVTTLKRCLGDEDVFVVAKTVEAIAELRGADLRALRDDLAAAARQNADMARSVVPILATNSSLQPQGRDTVVGLCKHEDAGVRAAALEALVGASSSLPVTQVLDGLKDEAREVRIVSARAITEADLEQEDYTDTAPSGLLGGLFGGGPSRARRRGPLAEGSSEQLLAAVRPIASAEDAEERLVGLTAMATLGEPDLAFPGLEEILMSRPEGAPQVLAALPSLSWEKRRALFDLARRTSLSEHVWSAYLEAVIKDAPKAAEDYLWQVFDEDPYVTATPRPMIRTVIGFYVKDTAIYRMREGEVSSAPELAAQAERRLAGGDPARRAMALILFRCADSTRGKAAELDVIHGSDGEVPETLRCTAIELALHFGDLDLTAAAGYLDHADPGVRAAAAAAAAAAVTPFSPACLIHVGEQSVYPGYFSIFGRMPSLDGNEADELPKVPDGFPVEKLERIARESGGGLESVAKYLRACRGDDEALRSLVADARERTYDDELAVAVGLAVAARGEDEDIQYVEAVYESLESYSRSRFATRMFTAFNHMRGPNVLRLRRELLRERRKARPDW